MPASTNRTASDKHNPASERFTMFLATCAIALFCLISASCSAPLGCEDLLRPLDHVDLHSENGWALVLASLVNPAHLERLRMRDSAWIKFSNSSNPGELLIERRFGFNTTCAYSSNNFTLEGTSFTYHSSNLTVTFLHTSCPDCLLLRFMESGKLRNLYLFSERRELEQKEVEEFSAQAECAKSLSPERMDPTKELCPAKTSVEPADQTEEQKS